MELTWKLALRNIFRNKRRTVLTMLLISMTLAILIFTDGYMKAMADVMIRSATRLYPGDGQVHHIHYLPERDGQQQITDLDQHIHLLQNESQIASYSPRALSFGMISSTANNVAVQVVGIHSDLEATVSKLKVSMVLGQYLNANGPDTQILLGSALADLLEVDLGDRLVVSVNNNETDEVDQRLFRVSGVFKMNSTFYDERLVFIQLPKAQQMMGLGENVHEIAFNFVDERLSSNESLGIWSRLSTQRTIAQGWSTLMPDLASMISMFDFSMLIVGFILFIVAALGVINAMFMSIYERTYEFGVLLAIGTRRSLIFKLILIEGFILSLFSLIAGAAIGACITLVMGVVGIDYGSMELSGVALAEVLRPELRLAQFTELPLAVFLMTMLACVYPAVHASKIIPATALHKSL